eukprot:366453-Chlamydomonas_euryale.AAC.15
MASPHALACDVAACMRTWHRHMHAHVTSPHACAHGVATCTRNSALYDTPTCRIGKRMYISAGRQAGRQADTNMWLHVRAVRASACTCMHKHVADHAC